MPLISIITPSFNQARFLEKTIRSVLLQGYPNLEYIVIDGESTDESVEIIKRYAPWISYWVSEPDNGQAAAINKGLRRAKGDVVAWLNSDDVYLPGAIAKAVSYLKEHPEVGLVYGGASFVAADGEVIDRYPVERYDPNRLIEICYVCQPATFIRRHVIEEVGFLDENLDKCMDYDLWIRISRRHLLGYCEELLAQSRLHRQCKTIRDRTGFCREVLGMLHRHYGFVPPSWVGAYARSLLEERLDRSVRWQNILFILGLAGVCAWEFVRYNRRLPLTELRRWSRGIRQGIGRTAR